MAGIINLLNCLTALTNGGLIPPAGDQTNITLGLFGFLVPVALAMSTRMLPLYAGIQPYPAPLLWLLALAYFAGVILWSLGPLLPGLLVAAMSGLGPLLIGIVMLLFIGYFLHLMRNRAGAITTLGCHPCPSPGSAGRARSATQTRGTTHVRSLCGADRQCLPVEIARHTAPGL